MNQKRNCCRWMALACACTFMAGGSRGADAVTVAQTYLVVDLSGGSITTNYPVSYLAALPPGGWTDEYKTTKLVLRRIPSGTFVMGSPTNELGRQRGEYQHQVTLSQDFYIGVFEVTAKQWERITGEGPVTFDSAGHYGADPAVNMSYWRLRNGSYNNAQGGVSDWPVSDNVDKESFMGVMRAHTGLTFDLPTEAQWEYACRAGTTTALNSGEKLSSKDADSGLAELARYMRNSGAVPVGDGVDPEGGTTAKVGSYRPNAWGLYDMHGNVWESCLDLFGPYPNAVNDPKGTTDGTLLHDHVARGGCFANYARACRSACRDSRSPMDADRYHGFRIAVHLGSGHPMATETSAATRIEDHFRCGKTATGIEIERYIGPGGNVVIPDKIDGQPITSIGDMAFARCRKVTAVTLPKSVTRIGESAFVDCDKLSGIVILNGVTHIGSGAFFDCSSLTNLTIPASVTKIGDDAIRQCENLATITVDPLSQDFCSTDGILFNKRMTRLIQCPRRWKGNYTIPNGVTDIGRYAFFRCTDLTGVTLPSSVINIENSAFAECHWLSSLKIPDGVVNIGRAAFHSCTSLTEVSLPESVDSIGTLAFSECSSLSGIVLPRRLTSLGSSTFCMCRKLTHMAIPESVTSLGPNIFDGCDSLTNITITGAITDIGSRAFADCTQLTRLTLPASVSRIDFHAFAGCSGMTDIFFRGDAPAVTALPLFDGTTNVTVYYLPGAKGWEPTFACRLTKPWNPQVSREHGLDISLPNSLMRSSTTAKPVPAKADSPPDGPGQPPSTLVVAWNIDLQDTMQGPNDTELWNATIAVDDESCYVVYWKYGKVSVMVLDLEKGNIRGKVAICDGPYPSGRVRATIAGRKLWVRVAGDSFLYEPNEGIRPITLEMGLPVDSMTSWTASKDRWFVGCSGGFGEWFPAQRRVTMFCSSRAPDDRYPLAGGERYDVMGIAVDEARQEIILAVSGGGRDGLWTHSLTNGMQHRLIAMPVPATWMIPGATATGMTWMDARYLYVAPQHDFAFAYDFHDPEKSILVSYRQSANRSFGKTFPPRDVRALNMSGNSWPLALRNGDLIYGKGYWPNVLEGVFVWPRMASGEREMQLVDKEGRKVLAYQHRSVPVQQYAACRYGVVYRASGRIGLLKDFGESTH